MIALKGDELELPAQPRRALLCLARDPGARLRDIAASLAITERSAHGIVTDLTATCHVRKQKDGRPTATRSRPHFRCPNPPPRNPPPAKS